MFAFVSVQTARNLSVHERKSSKLSFFSKTTMSTRSQKKKATGQETSHNVSPCLFSPVVFEHIEDVRKADVTIAGSSGPKSSRIENSKLRGLKK